MKMSITEDTIASHQVSFMMLGSCPNTVTTTVPRLHWDIHCPYRMNIDPNPHDSYRADEQPVQRAPAHTSIQGSTAKRRVGERRDQTKFQQRVNRSRHARSNRLVADSTEDRSRLRKQLQRRYRQRATNTADDEDRKAQRRTTRRRARR